MSLTVQPPIIHGEPVSRDIVHARCSAYVGRRLLGAGWQVVREVLIEAGHHRGWIDLLAFDPRSGTLLVIDARRDSTTSEVPSARSRGTSEPHGTSRRTRAGRSVESWRCSSSWHPMRSRRRSSRITRCWQRPSRGEPATCCRWLPTVPPGAIDVGSRWSTRGVDGAIGSFGPGWTAVGRPARMWGMARLSACSRTPQGEPLDPRRCAGERTDSLRVSVDQARTRQSRSISQVVDEGSVPMLSALMHAARGEARWSGGRRPGRVRTTRAPPPPTWPWRRRSRTSLPSQGR